MRFGWARARGRRAAVVLASAAVSLACGACSLLVHVDPAQCAVDRDCARFAGTACVSGGCVRREVPPPPPLTTSCTTTQDCLAFQGELFSICRKRDHVCTPILSRDCVAPLGAYKSDNAIFVGALLPLVGINASTGTSLRRALQLARDDFDRGLPSVDATSRRPIVLVPCDESVDPVRAARHLVETLGVPVILGATLTDATRSVAAEVTGPAGVLLLSPTSTGELGTGSSPLTRRTCPSDVHQGRAMSLVMRDHLEKRIAATVGGKIRVAVVRKSDTHAAGLTAALLQTLQLNGAAPRGAENDGYFIETEYGDPEGAGAATATARMSAAIAAVTNERALPDVIIAIGNTEAVTLLVSEVENLWPVGPRRPSYLLSSGVAVPELLELVARRSDLRTRILGTAPGRDPATDPLHNFITRYRQTWSDSSSSAGVFGTANVYDAFYVLALGMAALETRPLSGSAIADALSKLAVQGGPAIDVGPTALSTASGAPSDALFAQVAGGGVDLNGTSGPLDFDPLRGEVISDIQVWCIEREASGRPAFGGAGTHYVTGSDKLVGDVSRNCLVD